MAGGAFRDTRSANVSVEAIFRDLANRFEDVFWIDRSLTGGVSYLGTGIRMDPSEGFELWRTEGELAVQRVGWINYGASAESLGLSEFPEQASNHAMLFVSSFIEFDQQKQQISVVSANDNDMHRTLIELLDAVSDETYVETEILPSEAIWRDDINQYAAKIAECKQHIANGDVYQLCLTTSCEVRGVFDAVSVYLRLRASSPTVHNAFISIGGTSLLSSSPETFLSIQGNKAMTSPIKGTRPRGTDPSSDKAMRDELLESQKEQAENLMIVDLCRNDLATVSKTGSVKVDSLLAVESFSTVHQLVSTISGEIADGVTPSEVVRALFPAGSMTGAPKRSAVKILRNLESGQRGIYSGAHGFAGAGSLSLAMTIRSIVIDSLGASIGVGGGITADSKPEEEIVEVGVKAAALLSALGAAPNPYLHSE